MSTTRFTPNSFQYNGRVALAIVPCLAVACVLGGKPVLAALSIGAMTAYIMDALQYREGAFMCSWLTLSFADMAFIYSMLTTSEAPIPIMVAMIFTMGAVAALAGMWASLQFKWIQMQYPAVAIVFERNVITSSLPVAAIMHALGLATIVEYSDVPFYLAVILGVLYYSLGQPLPSSFHSNKAPAPGIGGGKPKPEIIVQSKGDAFWMALVTVIVPALLYVGIHWTVMNHLLHVYSVLLLASVPVLYLGLLPKGLWWMPGGPRLKRLLVNTLVGVSLLAALIGFEGRVVFYAFGQYIKLHPPWNWVAVTMALFGFAGVGVAHFLGALGTVLDVTIAGSFLLLCTTAGSLAVGVPFHWLPAPLVGACGLALFYDSHSLREYTVFVGGAFMTGVWFVVQHFWFLDISVGGMHLHLLCKMVLATLVPALLVPGLVFAGASKMAIGGLMVLQASLVCVLEEKLYVPSHEDFAGEVMYPGYLLVLTSAVGIIAARRLAAAGHVSPLNSWLLHCLYGAKLAMLVLPEAYLLLPTVLLALAVSAPYFLHTQEPRRRLRILPWQGLLHALSVVLAVALARFAIFDVVQFLVASRPSEGLLVGALLLALAVGLAPLVLHCYSGNQAALRALSALAMTGIMLLLLQPPTPIRGGARCPQLPLSLCPRLWDERHVPMHDVEDVEVWGKGLGRKEHWPRWLLVASLLVGLLGATANGAASRSVLGRLVFGAVAGLLVGSYVALEVVPGQVVLQVLVVVSSVLVVAFVALLQLANTRRAPMWLPVLAAVWFITFVLTMLLHAELPIPHMSAAMQRLFPDSQRQVEEESYRAAGASLMAVFASHALLMAFALKLKMSAALRQKEGAGAQDKDPMEGPSQRSYYGAMSTDLFCGVVPPQVAARFGKMLSLDGACGMAMQRLGLEGLAWVPTLGNLCTLLACFLAIVISGYLTGGSPDAIFMLAPLLLLLNQDPVVLPGLGDKQRYFPPALAVLGYLVVFGLVQILADSAALPGTRPQPALFIAKNLLAMAVTLPNHVMLLHYLWTQAPRAGLGLLLWTPLNLLPLALSDALAVKYLAGLACMAALLHYYSMKHVRMVGLKVI